MNIAKDNRLSIDPITKEVIKKSRINCNEKKKQCARENCTNLIPDHKTKHYCSHPKCVAFRDMKKAETLNKNRYDTHPKSINVIIPKKRQLDGKVLLIQCGAKGRRGRCKHTFHVPYAINRSRYPKYCEDHRNEYKRKRFED